MNKLFLKFTSFTLLLGLILPTTAHAQAENYFPIRTSRPIVQGAGGQSTNLLESFWNTPPRSQTSQSATRALKDVRKDDARQCLAESSGSSSLSIGEALIKPLEDNIKQDLHLNATTKTIDTVMNQGGQRIQEQLRTNLSQNVTDSLKQEFPRTFTEKIRALRATGLTDQEIMADRGRFRQLINDSIRESLPRAFSEELLGSTISDSIDRGIRNTVTDALTVNFRDIARPMVETYYRPHINAMVAQIPQMAQQQIQDAADTIRGSIDATQGLIKGLSSCFTNVVCAVTRGIQLIAGGVEALPEYQQFMQIKENLEAQLATTTDFLNWLKNLNFQQLEEDLINGFALQIEQSITDPKNIERLGDEIADSISSSINRSMNENLDNIFNSVVEPIRAFENAINTVDEAFLNPIIDSADGIISWATGSVNATTDRIIDSIGGQISASIDQTLGATLFPAALNITNAASEAGNWIALQMNIVGAQMNDFFFPPPEIQILPEGFVGAPGPGQIRYEDANILEPNGAAGSGITIVPSGTGNLAEGTMGYNEWLASQPAGTTVPLEATIGIGAEQAQAGVTQNAGNIANSAIGKQSGNLVTAGARTLVGGLGNAIGAGLGALVEGVPFIGPYASQLIQQVVSQAMNAAMSALGIGGSASALVTVPVTELGGLMVPTVSIDSNTGKILGESKQIKEMTEKILQLQIQSCTHLKIIQRIQYAMEEKEFVNDRLAQQSAARKAEQYKNDVREFVMKGREVLGGENGEKGSFIPTNLSLRANELANNQLGVMLAELKEAESIDVFAQKTRLALTEKPTNTKSTITQEELELFENAGFPQTPPSAPVSQRPSLWQRMLGQTVTPTPQSTQEESFWDWDLWDKIVTNPYNNPIGHYEMTKNELGRRIAEAEENLRFELMANGGVEGIKICTEWKTGEDGKKYCPTNKEMIVTPGMFIREQIAASETSYINFLTNVSEQGEDGLTQDGSNQINNMQNVVQDPEGLPLAPSILETNGYCSAPGRCPPVN